MTTSYDPTTDVGKVRLIISDKTDPFVFINEEIEVFLSENGDSINLAAATALEAWAASYSANADNEKIGDYSYAQNIVPKMLSLAKRLREIEAAKDMIPVMSWASFNFTDEESE